VNPDVPIPVKTTFRVVQGQAELTFSMPEEHMINFFEQVLSDNGVQLITAALEAQYPEAAAVVRAEEDRLRAEEGRLRAEEGRL
jgi:hypothetical protein